MRRQKSGIVLVGVLFFILLMASAVATFLRRASIDGLVARNRDQAARCDALVRGGIELSKALILQDRLDEQRADFRADTREDVWARVAGHTLRSPDGAALRLHIEEEAALLNLNALFRDGKPLDEDLTEPYLTELLSKVVEEMPGRPEEKLYEPEDLARNLIDWIDADDVRLGGGLEDAYYQEQNPPYRAPNRPLLSLEELALVEGFDRPLLQALGPYVTVYPIAGGDGINLNTAPSYVLALLYIGVDPDYRLADEEVVRRILDIRTGGGILCGSPGGAGCTEVRDVLGGQEVWPPLSWQSESFRATAEATCGDMRRTVEALIDRSDPLDVQVLEWRTR